LLLALFGHRGGICSGQLFENHNAQARDFYISRVMSGGVSVNEAILHVTQHDMPFGGVGASGMGHYHGCECFDNFSKLRPVFQQGRQCNS
jgi:coniferyl-aldehyde dehydrogenase